MERPDAARSLIDTLRRRRESDGQPDEAMRKVCLAARSCFSQPDGAMVLNYLESITLRTVHPPGTSNEVLQYREGMRHVVWMIRALITEGEEANAGPKPDPAGS